jgi:hypothetical protein
MTVLDLNLGKQNCFGTEILFNSRMVLTESSSN